MRSPGANTVGEQSPNTAGGQSPSKRPEQKRGHVTWFLFGVRYALPVAIVIAGVVVMSGGSESDMEGGAGIVGAGLAIYAINWLYRIAFEGDRIEREKEEAARNYLATHGHWPDEVPPRQNPSAQPRPAPLSGRSFARHDGHARAVGRRRG
jgi:hypothetical protein